jgi:hypothetical protein
MKVWNKAQNEVKKKGTKKEHLLQREIKTDYVKCVRQQLHNKNFEGTEHSPYICVWSWKGLKFRDLIAVYFFILL